MKLYENLKSEKVRLEEANKTLEKQQWELEERRRQNIAAYEENKADIAEIEKLLRSHAADDEAEREALETVTEEPVSTKEKFNDQEKEKKEEGQDEEGKEGSF